MVAVAAFEYDVLDYNRQSQESLNNITDAENILKFMIKELRTMSPSASGSYPILNAATSTITFYSDVNGDGVNDQVRYYLASTTLYRGVTIPSGTPPVYNSGNETISIIANDVRNSPSFPVFEYFDGNYDGTTAPLSYPLNLAVIRLVKVNLTLDTTPDRSPLPVTYTAQATLRNLKDNL